MPPPGEVEGIGETWVSATVITRPTTSGRSWSWPPPVAATSSHGVTRSERGTCTSRCRSPRLIIDFYDQLKSRVIGYASLDYAYLATTGDLVKLDIMAAASRRRAP